MTIDLKHLRAVAEAAMPLNLTQQGDCFTSKEMEYLVAVSNPSTTLSLIDRLEKAEFLLTDLAEARARMIQNQGELAQFARLIGACTPIDPETTDCGRCRVIHNLLCDLSPTDALDAIREAQEVLSKMSGIPSAQEALQKLNAVFGEVGNG